jgi:hypothetical protein
MTATGTIQLVISGNKNSGKRIIKSFLQLYAPPGGFRDEGSAKFSYISEK